MTDNNSLQANEYFKNLNKHENCSKCNIVLTQENYKKGRTVCKLCYNNHVLEYYKNKFSSYSYTKSDVGTQTDFSDKQDSLIKQESSNKKVRSSKKDSSSKQTISNKQDSFDKLDISCNNIIDTDPDLLCDKFREIVTKPVMLEDDYTMSKMIIDELLRTKCIPRKQHKALCEKLGFV